MYTLDFAYGSAATAQAQWSEIDTAVLLQLPVNQIYNLYKKLYLTLSSPTLLEPINIDFDIFRTEHLNDDSTLEDMLTALDNNSLQTIDKIPLRQTVWAQYEDAFKAGYKIEVTAPYSHPSSIVHPEDKTEIRIIRNRTNMRKFYDYCMVSVNGYFHLTDTDDNYVYLVDGGASLLKSRLNNIGILSFEKVGKIKQTPITKEMVYTPNEGGFISQRAYFDLSSIDTENKTVMLVIGGYLYLPDPAYVRQYSENSWMIDFTGVPLMERYFESLPYLNMKNLGLSEYPRNFTQINKEQFFSNDHFIKYLTMSQSFVVTIDSDQLFTQKHFLRHNNYPGMFTTYTEPKFPLVTANGRVAEYWKTYEDGHWSVNVHDSYLHHRVASSINQNDVISMTDACLPYRTYYNSNGYMLEIGAHKLI